MTNPTYVTNVVSTNVASTMKLPGDLIIHATGEVPTGGWSDPILSRRFYIVPPEDGILHLDFFATPPSGMAIQVVSPIQASIFIANGESADFWGPGKPLTSVRIHAATNSVDIAVDGNQRAPEFPLVQGLGLPVHDPDVPVPLRG